MGIKNYPGDIKGGGGAMVEDVVMLGHPTINDGLDGSVAALIVGGSATGNVVKATSNQTSATALRANNNHATDITTFSRIDMSGITTVGEKPHARLGTRWTDNADATRTSTFIVSTAQAGAFSDVMAFVGPDVGIGLLTPLARAHIQQDSAGTKVVRMETTTTGDNPIMDVRQLRGTTTNATPTQIGTIDMSVEYGADVVVQVTAFVTARRTGGGGTVGDGAAFLCIGVAQNIAGAGNMIAASTDFVAGRSVGTEIANIIVAGADSIALRVTGVAATNYTWHGTLFITHLNA
jgi:hypothetical protein